MGKWMKRLAALMLAAMMLAGCGQTTQNESSESENVTEESASESETSNAGTVADLLAALPETLEDGEVVATPEMYPNVNFDEHYTVYLYLIGDTPQDWDRVMELINEYLEPFNTTLETVIMSWADYSTQYSLVLASGEDIDAIYTAPWCFMYTEASKGSFYTYDRDFITENMPLTNKYQDETSYSEATIDGQIVALPCNQEKADTKIVAIRQDLADKYGIEELNDWSDYMNYMLTIAEEETPQSGILAMAASGSNGELWEVYRQQYDALYLLKDNYLNYEYSYVEGQLPSEEDVQLSWNTDYFLEFAKDMKTMADAGCWSRSALSNTISDDDAFAALQGSSIAWNGTVYNYMRLAEESEGVECAAYDLTKDNIVACEEYNNSDIAIATASKDPVRTAMVIDILKMDTYVNKLVTLGIEGEHYSIDGFEYQLLDASDSYPANSTSLSWGVNNGLYQETGVEERQQVMVDSWEPRIVSNPTVTFVFNDASVADYSSACKTILGEYIPSLQLGLVDDVEAYIAEMNTKLEAAGIGVVEEELFAQYSEWVATR
ncbi:MAG: ABC transporter substrate-binding protein [Lachnospiraceae bacterium]|nr:ABC transporter substrate-binding protein [Lachnospiraceae bacterium]